jgi:hypothetical protein
MCEEPAFFELSSESAGRQLIAQTANIARAECEVEMCGKAILLDTAHRFLKLRFAAEWKGIGGNVLGKFYD